MYIVDEIDVIIMHVKDNEYDSWELYVSFFWLLFHIDFDQTKSIFYSYFLLKLMKFP